MKFRRLPKEPAPWRWGVRLRKVWDRLRGLDFLRVIHPQDVGLDPSLANRSSPSGDKYLVHALQTMSIGPAHCILDIGCGKGSAMRAMLRFQFARVDGVELSEAIANIARKNFKTLGVSPRRCQVFAKDAMTIDEDLDAYTHFYLYNPFPSPVMRVVAQNLCRSLERRPRAVHIIYNTPACHADIEATGAFELEHEFAAEWGNKMFVYRSRLPRAEAPQPGAPSK